ncbi:MAG: hypothetical protein GY757_27600 [bacterium]|nr:hypothetical protein [bacterium]
MKNVALLGSQQVRDIKTWRIYAPLENIADIEVPPNPESIHQLISDIKLLGPENPSVIKDFIAIITQL